MRRIQALPETSFDGRVQLRLHGPRTEGRASLERYIAGRYARRYGARLTDFTPWLLSAARGEAPDAAPGAALGLRPALAEPLFLERYLDRPVEQQLAARLRRPVDRCGIVEIGNLAASEPAARRLLFAALVELLARSGHQWLVCTATARVRCLIGAMGLPLLTLAAADPQRLGAEREQWGGYYQGGPRVVAGEIATARAAIAACPEYRASLAPLLPALERIAAALG